MKKLWSTKVGRLAVAGIVAAGAVVGISIAANGAVKPDCKTLSYPLCPRSVAAGQVVDNSLPKSKIAPADRDAFLKDTDVKGDAQLSKTFAPKEIAHLGGAYFAGFTTIGTFTLPKGTWLVNTTVVFNRTVAGAADSMPQVGLRIGQGTASPNWGTEVGTIGGVAISPAKGHDLFGSAVKLITVSQDTEVGVYGFGYNYDQGTAGSGEITAAVQVVAARA